MTSSERTFTPADDVSVIVGMFRRELKQPDQPFTLLVRFSVRDGGEDGVVQEFEQARAPTLGDPGCLAFELHRQAQSRRFVVHEKWRCLADLDAHLRTPHAIRLRRAYDAVIVGLPEFDVLVPPDVRDNRDTSMNTPHHEAAMKRPVTAQLRGAPLARAVTDGEIVLATIDVRGPPERAFRALMSAECERWWGAPGVYTTESWHADVRTGGSWSLVTRLPDGTGLPASGEFLEVAAPSKVVQTRRYDWAHPTLARAVTRVTTRLAAIDAGAGTRITVRHEGFGSSEPAYEHAGGWERLLDWLGAYLGAEAGAVR